MTDSQINLPPRGSFPKGPRGETREQRRERYELWVLGTRAPQPDYEGQSIAFYRGKTTQVRTAPGSPDYKTVDKAPSRRLCINSACWRCEAGHEDSGAQERIAQCSRSRCGLHAVRPYREHNTATADERRRAVSAYCLECTGGSYQEARLCHSVTCPVWPVRPGAYADSRPDSAAQPQTAIEEGEE